MAAFTKNCSKAWRRIGVVTLGLALLTIVMSATMLFWLRTVESSLAGFLGHQHVLLRQVGHDGHDGGVGQRLAPAGGVEHVATRDERYVEIWFLHDSAITHWKFRGRMP